jgi:hypothetical protein
VSVLTKALRLEEMWESGSIVPCILKLCFR